MRLEATPAALITPFSPTPENLLYPQVARLDMPTFWGARTVKTNNIEIDDRGYIYMLDRRGTGLHIVALTGDAHAVVGLP